MKPANRNLSRRAQSEADQARWAANAEAYAASREDRKRMLAERKRRAAVKALIRAEVKKAAWKARHRAAEKCL